VARADVGYRVDAPSHVRTQGWRCGLHPNKVQHPNYGGQHLMTYRAEPGSDSAAALDGPDARWPRGESTRATRVVKQNRWTFDSDYRLPISHTDAPVANSFRRSAQAKEAEAAGFEPGPVMTTLSTAKRLGQDAPGSRVRPRWKRWRARRDIQLFDAG